MCGNAIGGAKIYPIVSIQIKNRFNKEAVSIL